MPAWAALHPGSCCRPTARRSWWYSLSYTKTSCAISLTSSLPQAAASILLPTLCLCMQDLKKVIKELLIEFVRANGGRKPSRILFFRDGVSEGQFPQVRHLGGPFSHSHLLMQ